MLWTLIFAGGATNVPLPLAAEWADAISDSLLAFASNTHSQQGEDGILSEIFSRLGVRQGFFVDVGASDGLTNSNTRLMADRGWAGLMIEANPTAFGNLSRSGVCGERVACLHERVGFRPGESELLALLPKDCNIDFLSIDIGELKKFSHFAH